MLRLALLVLLVLGALALRLASGADRAAAPIAAGPSDRGAPPATPAIRPSEARAPRAPAAGAEPTAAPDAVAAERAVDEAVVRLVALDAQLDFHEAAWPLVLELARLIAGSPEAARRLDAVRTASALPDRARGALLVAAALGREPAEGRAGRAGRALARAGLAARSIEVERAAWTARALARERFVWTEAQAREPGVPSAGGEPPPARPVDVARFDPRRFRAELARALYPVTFGGEPDAAEVDLALERVRRERPSAPEDAPFGPGGAGGGELVTRELVVLAVLGPAAVRPGPARRALLGWLAEPEGGAHAPLRGVAAFCLAAAAGGDGALRDELLERAAADPACAPSAALLARLARAEGLGSERLATLFAALLDAPLGPHGMPTREQLAGIEALGDVLASHPDDAAWSLLVDRVLDPTRAPEERYLLLGAVPEGGDPVATFAAREVLRWDEDPMLVARAAILLADTRPDERDASRELVVARFPEQQDPLARKGLIHCLARLGDDASLAFLRTVAQDDPDAPVRAYARRALRALRALRE